ncbi:MAG: tryptophan 2,3-dioxygenase family protein [Spirillospora sp.]
MTTTADLESWLQRCDIDKFPYDEIVRQFHLAGKHFVSKELLDTLDGIRGRLSELSAPWADVRTLLAFLDTALDKPDGRYDYPTYLALDLLDLPGVDDPVEHAPYVRSRCDRTIVQLVADALNFELSIAEGYLNILPELRPDASMRTKRYRHGVRAIRPALRRLGLADSVIATEPEQIARQVCSVVRADMSQHERLVMRLSNLPVASLHDEYLFLRVLQAFETSFSFIAVQLRAAIAALAEHEVDKAERFLTAAQDALLEVAPLFSMLATMQVESFRTFRNFTEGASAIQSRNYKIVEALCRTPEPDRVDSAAYRSVPEIRERVLAGGQTLDDGLTAMRESADFTAADRDRVQEAMKGFARALLRWRTTHYRLAVRMLGDATGTGYTEGTPYLDAVRDVPVFEAVDLTKDSEYSAEEDQMA